MLNYLRQGFSTGKPTMVALYYYGEALMGQRHMGLTFRDILLINRMYGCIG